MNRDGSESQGRLARLMPWILGMAVVLILGVSIFAFRISDPTATFELEATGRLVVLPIRNATGERQQDWLRLGLTEMLAETLRHTHGIRVVAPARVSRMMQGRGLDAEDDEGRRRLRTLGRALGADLVADITARRRQGRRGASDEDLYTLHLEMQGNDDRVVAETELSGPDPVRIAERLASLLAGALGGVIEPISMRRVYSPSPFLNRLHGMGLAALHTGGAAAARPYFEIALEVEPNFLPGRFRLAECRRRQGELDRARRDLVEFIATAQNRGERIWESRALRALALVEALDGQTKKAVELATQLRVTENVRADEGAFLEVLEDLARFALAGGEESEALALYQEINELQQRLGNFLGQTETLAQIGALALRADDLDGAREAFERARDLARELGDVRTEIQVLASLGEVMSRQGNGTEAVNLWRRAAIYYEQRGETTRRMLLLRNIAEALLAAEDFEAAEDTFKDMRELAAENGDEPLEGLASLRLTWIQLRLGYPFQARVHLDRALELDRSIDEPLTLQRLIAWMAYEEGNYELAVDTLAAVKRQAGDEWREIDEAFLEAFVTARAGGERVPLPGAS